MTLLPSVVLSVIGVKSSYVARRTQPYAHVDGVATALVERGLSRRRLQRGSHAHKKTLSGKNRVVRQSGERELRVVGEEENQADGGLEPPVDDAGELRVEDGRIVA